MIVSVLFGRVRCVHLHYYCTAVLMLVLVQRWRVHVILFSALVCVSVHLFCCRVELAVVAIVLHINVMFWVLSLQL